MGGGAGARAQFFAARPPALAWAPAAIIVVELGGSTFGAPFAFSLLFFVSVVALLLRRGSWSGQVWRRSWRRFAGGLVVVLGVVSVWIGLPRTGAPAFTQLGADVRLALAGVGCLAITLGIAWCGARRASFRDLERFGCLLAASFAWLLASGYRVQRLVVFPSDPVARGVALGATCVLLGLAATAGRWQPARFLVLLGVGITVRVLGLGVWQPDPAVRDMLPLVQSAGDALASGEAPYGLYAMQRGSVVPLTYLPGLWLLHNLPRAIDLPLRTTSLLADAAVVLSFWWAAAGARGIGRWRARCLALGLSAAWLLSPSVQWNAIYAEPHPYWAVLALLGAATLRGHFTVAAVLLGLALATRQFAWVLGPFWLLWAVRELGFVRALERLLVLGAVALVLVVPFVAADPDSFWFGTLHWFTDYGSVHRTWFLKRLGFAGTFYAANLESWLIPLQVVTAVGGLGLALKTSTARGLAGVTAATYTLVIMLCPVIWSSFYLDSCLVISGVAMITCEARPSPALQRFRRRYWLPLAVEAAGLCWLAYGFWNAASESGLAQARATLQRQARAGDLLVDRGKRRVAFVQPPLFEAPASTRVVASEFDASLPDLGVLSAPRVGLLFRESRDISPARALQQLGAVVARGGAGDYRWLVVEPLRVLEPLLAGFSGGAFRTLGRALPLEPSAGRGLAPPVPSVVDVRRAGCLVAGRSRRMLFAHPSDQGELELVFVAPAGARRLVLLAGFDDRSVRWGRAEANLRLYFESAAAGDLRVRNLPGVQWSVFSLPHSATKALKLVVTTPDDRQRWLCLDGAWL